MAQRGYDFDRCSGIVSNPRLIYPEITTAPFNRLFWEGSYSPDGTLFYVSTSRWASVNESYLIQYDLNSVNVPNSADTIDLTYPPIGSGAVRLAPDGKIYYSRAYESLNTNSFPYADSMYNYINMNLSVINNPNSIGVACDFQPFSFYLGGKRTYYGLPNNPDYELGPVVGSVCDSLSLEIKQPSVKVNKLLVYPNPFTNEINVRSPSNFPSNLKIENEMGTIIFSKEIIGDSKLELSFLSEGIYFFEIISNNFVGRVKVVKLM